MQKPVKQEDLQEEFEKAAAEILAPLEPAEDAGGGRVAGGHRERFRRPVGGDRPVEGTLDQQRQRAAAAAGADDAAGRQMDFFEDKQRSVGLRQFRGTPP